MKAFTDLEQSKKLAEILPLESADMVYIKHSSSDNPTWEFNEDFPPMILGDVPIKKIFAETLPCWSLAALLGLMPKLYEDLNDGGCQPNLCKGWDNNQWHIVYRSSIYITKWYNDPIDAAIEMIVWLKENNRI